MTDSITLHDGRTLSFSMYGETTAPYVLLFHGHPGSRIFTLPPTPNLAARVFLLDRPGYGSSSFLAGRNLLDWADDVLQFADTLGLERFAVAGYSGGGPHALACAYAMPERISRVASVSGCAPFQVPHITKGLNGFNRWMYATAAQIPWLIELLFSPLGWIVKNHIKLFLHGFAAPLPASDQKLLLEPSLVQMLEAHIREAFVQGARGFSWEATLLGQPWGFDLADIVVPVDIWQGLEDRNVSFEMAQYLLHQIPNATPYFFPNEGHLVTLLHHWQDILKSLLE
jgi:pimeloyl-ACP methyl ester carboxylesterase